MKLGIVKVKLDHDVNCYIVSCAATKEAVVVDPGLPAEKVAEHLHDLKVRWIVATHCHHGHVAGKDTIKDLTGGGTPLPTAHPKQFLPSARRHLLDRREPRFAEFKSRTRCD